MTEDKPGVRYAMCLTLIRRRTPADEYKLDVFHEWGTGVHIGKIVRRQESNGIVAYTLLDPRGKEMRPPTASQSEAIKYFYDHGLDLRMEEIRRKERQIARRLRREKRRRELGR